jgi:3-dehydroquinate dehydratase II
VRDAILVLNGPNLNALGRREPEKYGDCGLQTLQLEWQAWGVDRGVRVLTEQSNFEGQLVDRLHQAEVEHDIAAVVFNPGALTHTSRALRDAIASISIPVIEVHITNVAAREEWRRHSTVAEVCAGSIVGLGTLGYKLGLTAAVEMMQVDS